ncbi:MAG: M48 family metallopeptidase, partial [Candidatus Omnitrophica bacterium]|nr:M48 family metallopeptidase [Candidatus Omnitrophota bacterium]
LDLSARTMPNRSKKKLLLILLLIFSSCGCATIYNPATGRNERLIIDTAQEVSIGKDMDKELRQNLSISHDAIMQNRLDSIGCKMAAVSDRQDLSYAFRLVDDKELNAFAIPGGFIFVNTGLMQAANDDELACVLGHEIGHVAARHAAKSIQANLGYQILAGVAIGATGGQSLGTALDSIYALGSLKYSRADETFADKLSVRYSMRAGYNPYGMATFLEKLYYEERDHNGSYTAAFLRSHPDVGQRIKAVVNEIISSRNKPK